ncbi:MAG TPA: ATP synthase F1 subunit epsilon [Patescibacteria group bacterium]|uniref:ATP synthase epsilon chain n=1 Tax=Candidatus Woesebacteria bacterium RIFCSPHIGHO2_01_FULL_41_10 TaxID=1802500 RepID=A0A1F7YPW6_9BACT|nr:MAG: ATP synthase F1 subunit epsilon [Candidatus Woesebacteria bacterium RIFCSPHIGHO2_01_FULL_41_10]HLD01443.1 ATP synthase F1 subunit epsilon [Patescibacteria group bacterium]
MATLSIQITTPNRTVIDAKNIVMVSAQGVEGDFAVLPNHIPFVTKINPGIVRIRSNEGNIQTVAVGPGFFQVADNTVIVLTDEAILPEEADKRRAEEVREKAQALLQEKLEGTDFQKVEAELRRSLLELKLIEHTER